jgi:hypothetical protein
MEKEEEEELKIIEKNKRQEEWKGHKVDKEQKIITIKIIKIREDKMKMQTIMMKKIMINIIKMNNKNNNNKINKIINILINSRMNLNLNLNHMNIQNKISKKTNQIIRKNNYNKKKKK